MTFEKLVNELKFDTGDTETLIKLNENIEKTYPELYNSLLNDYLINVDKCVASVREMATKVCICEELLGLWFCLRLAVLRMYPEYKARGIDEEHFFEAVANCHRYILATKDFSGKFGIIIDRYIRAFSHLIELRAFRIGAFNFEFIKFDSECEYCGKTIKAGTPCLSLHIPINTDISDESINCNFSLAKDFFKRHFRMETPICQLYSWLIHPSVAECLPGNSKLVKFYNRFYLYEIKNNPISAIEYVYGISYAEDYKRGNRNFESYPEKTSLQRKFKERLIKGLPLGTAKGITLL